MEFLKYSLGIDMAMEKFDVCISIIDKLQHVMIRAQCRFNNNKKGFEAFILWVTKNTKLAIPAVYLMEATGIYYEQLAWFLHDKQPPLFTLYKTQKKSLLNLKIPHLQTPTPYHLYPYAIPVVY